MQTFVRNLKKGNNLWWIAAFSVLGFFLCAATAFLLKYLFPAQPAELPTVPNFVYSTSTPVILPAQQTPTATLPPNSMLVTVTPALFLTTSPAATPTNAGFSLFNWFFPSRTTTQPQPTPIQAIVVTYTPPPSGFPSPPPLPSPSSITCRNVLYPARPGSQWLYYINTSHRQGDVLMSVTGVEGTQATVQALELNDNSMVQTYVQCDQDVILNFPFVSGQRIFGEMLGGNMNVDYVGGVLAPNEAAFTSSNWALSWNIQYRVYGNTSLTYNGTNFNVAISPSDLVMTCQTLGAGNAAFETVTVPAGTFNALKVICRGQGQVTANVNGSMVTGTISAQSTQWFAPNVGMLKLQSDYANLGVFGMTIPLLSNIEGYVELKSYAIGQ